MLFAWCTQRDKVNATTPPQSTPTHRPLTRLDRSLFAGNHMWQPFNRLRWWRPMWSSSPRADQSLLFARTECARLSISGHHISRSLFCAHFPLGSVAFRPFPATSGPTWPSNLYLHLTIHSSILTRRSSHPEVIHFAFTSTAFACLLHFQKIFLQQFFRNVSTTHHSKYSHSTTIVRRHRRILLFSSTFVFDCSYSIAKLQKHFNSITFNFNFFSFFQVYFLLFIFRYIPKTCRRFCPFNSDSIA